MNTLITRKAPGRSGLHSAAPFLVVVMFLAGAASLLWYSTIPYAVFVAFGFFSLAILVLPFAINTNQSLLSNWSFVGLSVFIGCFLRGLYVGFEFPDVRLIERLFTLGERPDYFLYPFALMSCGLLITALVYSFYGGAANRIGINTQNYVFSSKRLYFLSILCLLISATAVVAYIQLTGGFDMANLSSKRSTISSLDLGSEHRTWKSLKTIASLSILAHLFVLYDAITGRRNRAPKYILALMLLLVGVFLPFYSSVRSEAVVYLILSLMVVYGAGNKVPWKKIIMYLFAMILLLTVMSVMRAGGKIGSSEFKEKINATGFIDSMVLNRNGAELGKTAHIINSIPGVLDYELGSTILVWLAAPIPREIWNDKPLVSSGPIIGTRIYGNRVSGVPPGFYAEMYWNFGIFGILFGSAFFGFLLKWLDTKFRIEGHMLVVYVFGVAQAGHGIIGVGLGYGLFQAAIKLVMGLVFCALIFRRAPVPKAEISLVR